MTDSCKSRIKGILGNYCPLLMFREGGSPFCDGSDELKGNACFAWSLAQKISGKIISKPHLDMDNIGIELPYAIDYLLSGKKILAVEDNPVSMKVLEKTLGDLAPLVIKAKNGQHALDILAETPNVGLILLDMDMPIMNGTEFMSQVSTQYDSKIPYAVVLVSELKNWAEAKVLIGQGVLSYVKKPYTHAELLDTICRSLFMFRESKNFATSEVH